MNDLNNMQNYEQKKNNGKGVFYGVIAVATLIVAIIGATFAYFTASANSSNGALSATAAHVQVTYHEGRQLVATNLIPSKADVVAKAYKRPTAYETNVANGCTHTATKEANPESMTSAANWEGCNSGKSPVSTGDVGTKCVDDNGYYVCAVYQFTVTNTSNVKQALQAYMEINSNGFTTVDNAAAAAGQTLAGDHSNGALKFMTVRSKNEINVNAISSTTGGTNCKNDLSFESTQSVKSTKFCIPDTENEGQYIADTGAETFTDTSGNYYYFNTTALRQSLLASGTQPVFSGEILPSIAANYLTSSNQLVYMSTTQKSPEVTSLGNANSPTPVASGSVVADSNGNIYEAYVDPDNSENNLTAMQVCQRDKEFNATCSNVYLSTTSCQRYNDAYEVIDETCYGVYGQVNRTYYIVAWLEENNPDNTLKFTGGDDGSGNWSGTLTKKAHDRGKTTADNLDQDDDQDASFATTINVTSGALGSAGITGKID